MATEQSETTVTGLYVTAPRIENVFVVVIEGTDARVAIKASGEVVYDGELSDASRAFYNAIGDAVASAQSIELRQLREDLAALKGRME